MKILIIYPHGLGDCILATPALRELRTLGHFVGFAMLKRFKSSEMFDRCPYIDELVWIKDPWNDFANVKVGYRLVEAECKSYGQANDYDNVVFPKHPGKGSKIEHTINALGISTGNLKTDVFISKEDRLQAKEICEAHGLIHNNFGFIHSSSPSLPPKDFPEGYGRKWLAKHCVEKDFIEVGIDFSPEDVNINVQFALMNLASSVALIDSVFYHAAGALDKKIDLAFFNRGKAVYDRVRPLHPVDQNIVYKLDPIT